MAAVRRVERLRCKGKRLLRPDRRRDRGGSGNRHPPRADRRARLQPRHELRPDPGAVRPAAYLRRRVGRGRRRTAEFRAAVRATRDR